MFIVDAVPIAYLDNRLNEHAERRRAEKKAQDDAKAKALTIPLPPSNVNSAVNTPMPSPGLQSPPQSSQGQGGVFGYFNAWSRKAEGCAVPGNKFGADGRKCPEKKPESSS